jgi:hypothetical protein
MNLMNKLFESVSDMSTTAFYIGCAVWGYKDWIGELFPPGSKSGDFLSLYSRRLTTVEGNTTFYAKNLFYFPLLP